MENSLRVYLYIETI